MNPLPKCHHPIPQSNLPGLICVRRIPLQQCVVHPLQYHKSGVSGKPSTCHLCPYNFRTPSRQHCNICYHGDLSASAIFSGSSLRVRKPPILGPTIRLFRFTLWCREYPPMMSQSPCRSGTPTNQRHGKIPHRTCVVLRAGRRGPWGHWTPYCGGNGVRRIWLIDSRETLSTTGFARNDDRKLF